MQDEAEVGLQDLTKSTAVEDPLLTKRPHRNGEHLQLFFFCTLHFTSPFLEQYLDFYCSLFVT